MKKVTRKEKKLYTETPSIFAVSYKEIARRHFFAGFVSGLGASLATILVGFIVTVGVVGVLRPRIEPLLRELKTTLERTGFISVPLPEK